MKSVREILDSVKRGTMTISKAEMLLKLDAIEIVDEIARLDVNRFQRRGVPEIVYSSGKTQAELSKIVSHLFLKGQRGSVSLPILISRLSKDAYSSLRDDLAEIKSSSKRISLEYFPQARMAAIIGKPAGGNSSPKKTAGRVALISAGTSDIFAIEEAQVVLKLTNCNTIRFNDLGVAALHRLKKPLREIYLFDPDAIIIAAGMEGALPSVVAGLSGVPVIGIPISSGYGYGGRGESALMSMLQACSLGISVVNIDSGVAAGIVASLIANRCASFRKSMLRAQREF